MFFWGVHSEVNKIETKQLLTSPWLWNNLGLGMFPYAFYSYRCCTKRTIDLSTRKSLTWEFKDVSWSLNSAQLFCKKGAACTGYFFSKGTTAAYIYVCAYTHILYTHFHHHHRNLKYPHHLLWWLFELAKNESIVSKLYESCK